MRIAVKPLTQYPWYVRLVFGAHRRRYGEVLAPAWLWARSPRLFLAMSAMHGMLNRRNSPLPAGLRALVRVHVSQLNACAFCIDFNVADLARQDGAMPVDATHQDWRHDDRFDARDRAVLDYAEAMTAGGGDVNGAYVPRLREYFSDDAIIELTALIAFQNLSARFNRALDVPAQGFAAREASDPSTSAAVSE